MQRNARSDRDLKEDFQRLLLRMVSDGPGDTADYLTIRAKLTESQLSWVKYRDANCWAKYVLYAQGSVKRQVELECLIRLTELREKELTKWPQTR